MTPPAWPPTRLCGRPAHRRWATARKRSRDVRASHIEQLTAITGDTTPLHYDEAAAASTPFGGIVVQGGVTSGILNAVVAGDLPGPSTVSMTVNWEFTAPVRPDDTITGAVEVTAVARTDRSPNSARR